MITPCLQPWNSPCPPPRNFWDGGLVSYTSTDNFNLITPCLQPWNSPCPPPRNFWAGGLVNHTSTDDFNLITPSVIQTPLGGLVSHTNTVLSNFNLLTKILVNLQCYDYL